MASLHQLNCFLQVYSAGSLTAAAERMGYAQPSISEQIRTLEQTVGTRLFARVGRGVVPTSAAEEMRPHAERAVIAYETQWGPRCERCTSNDRLWQLGVWSTFRGDSAAVSGLATALSTRAKAASSGRYSML